MQASLPRPAQPPESPDSSHPVRPTRPRPRPRRVENLTLKVDGDSLMWARVRALYARTTVNEVIRTFLDEYAGVPQAFRDGLPPPWTQGTLAAERFREPIGPAEAGAAARRDASAGQSAADDVLEVVATPKA